MNIFDLNAIGVTYLIFGIVLTIIVISIDFYRGIGFKTKDTHLIFVAILFWPLLAWELIKYVYETRMK